MNVLTVHNVEKSFVSVQAVAGVSFTVRRGEIFALLGPNGAGKTTLVRMLLGLFPPDSGRFEYALHGSPAPPSPADLGYLPEDRGLYKDIPILRTLIYFARLRGMARREARHAAASWIDRMGLAARASDRLETLSKGNQQKVQFISAILHRPALAILDEPFSGLDPLNQDFFSTIIRELRDGGMTILLSAHQMQVVQKLADRMLLMNRGREVVSGTLDEIRKKTPAAMRLGLRVRGSVDAAAIGQHPAIVQVEANGDGRVWLHLRDGAPISEVLIHAGRSADVLEVWTQRLNLHDIYIRMLGDGRPDGDSLQ